MMYKWSFLLGELIWHVLLIILIYYPKCTANLRSAGNESVEPRPSLRRIDDIKLRWKKWLSYFCSLGCWFCLIHFNTIRCFDAIVDIFIHLNDYPLCKNNIYYCRVFMKHFTHNLHETDEFLLFDSFFRSNGLTLIVVPTESCYSVSKKYKFEITISACWFGLLVK